MGNRPKAGKRKNATRSARHQQAQQQAYEARVRADQLNQMYEQKVMETNALRQAVTSGRVLLAATLYELDKLGKPFVIKEGSLDQINPGVELSIEESKSPKGVRIRVANWQIEEPEPLEVERDYDAE